MGVVVEVGSLVVVGLIVTVSKPKLVRILVPNPSLAKIAPDVSVTGVDPRTVVAVLVLKGTVSLDGLDPLTGGAIFGGSSYTTAMESKSTIPRSIAFGYAYQPNKKWTIEADAEWTGWSCVKEEFLTYPNETPGSLKSNTLNTDNPASRDWRSVWAYGIGAEYQATDKLELRGGFLYEQSPIPSVNFEPVLPDSNKHGITMGAGYLLKNVKIDASYAFFKYTDRDITRDAVGATTTNVNGKYKGYVNILGLSLTYKY